MDRTTRMDRTIRVDRPDPVPSAPRHDEPRVITLPPKQRVNMALAAIAGALLILVVVVAHGTFSRGSTSTPAASFPALTSAPTSALPAPAAPAKAGGKGKGHD